ncbi:hypothetical protein HZH66_007538 [Vespula vulgaris]|uniref:Uncharacterized protein n=1 Tax=Vespula vulgaris TaxID=7454 RepID=A0A834K3N9_VESVU|nr:hypothetical protein HZH66_007538 [Vespula vulgaris]
MFGIVPPPPPPPSTSLSGSKIDPAWHHKIITSYDRLKILLEFSRDFLGLLKGLSMEFFCGFFRKVFENFLENFKDDFLEHHDLRNIENKQFTKFYLLET